LYPPGALSRAPGNGTRSTPASPTRTARVARNQISHPRDQSLSPRPSSSPNPAGPTDSDAQIGRSYGKHHHEGAARSWRSLRASDQALEPKDEGIHLRRAQRHLHHRPPEDAENV